MPPRHVASGSERIGEPGDGRYVSSYDDEALVIAVGDVLVKAAVPAGSPVSQRRFDDLREAAGHPNLPSARQIATRLELAWPAVVERHIVLAVRRAASLQAVT